MSFFPADEIDNEDCLSLLLQIVEEPSSGELFPVFYVAAPSVEFLSMETLVALHQGLTHAKDKVAQIIEQAAND